MEKVTLDKIMNGLTPDLIPFKIGEYREEFENLKIQYAEENGFDVEDEDVMYEIDETVFRAFVMHKVAAMESILQRVVGFLNGENEENGE